MIMEKKRQV